MPRSPRQLVIGFAALSGITAAVWLSRPRILTNKQSPFYATITSNMASSTAKYKSTPYSPPAGGLPAPKPDDFKRMDEEIDAQFYTDSRFVTHIDDNAIASLSRYYDTVIPNPLESPASSTVAPIVLDLCSSWISHYPPRVEQQAKEGRLLVYGQGMNAAELKKNPLFSDANSDSTHWVVQDLNVDPSISKPLSAMGLKADNQKVSTTTLTVSIDYLTQPHVVLASLREHTVPGGSVHLAISNRCFPTKAVRRWMHASEEDRLRMCCEDLHRAGWSNIEVVEITDGSPLDGGDSAAASGGLRGLMAAAGFSSSGDPLWVVRATNNGT